MSDADRYPWRGLGLSSNLDAGDAPHPYRLLDGEPGLFDFVEYSAPLSLEEARAQASLFGELWARKDVVPVLFHPVHLNLFGPALEEPDRVRAAAEQARAVGSAWVGNDIGWWHAGGQPFPGYLYVGPPMDEGGVADAVAHAKHVQALLGEVPLLLENPVVTARRGPRHVLDFMAEVHRRTGCDLVLDVGHLWSHQLTFGLPAVDDAFDRFPFDRVIELHLAGGVVTTRGPRRFYADDHTQPVREEVFELLEAVLPRCTNLRALTFEGDGHPDPLAARTLRRLRAMMPQGPGPAVAPASAPSPLGTEGWSPRCDGPALFEAAHGLGPQEDPEGAQAEADFRLAVIAEQLDARWPLSRLLLCGTRERLGAFAASDEYRQVFVDPMPGLGLDRAFAAFARRACLHSGQVAAAAPLALELWIGSQHRHAEGRAGQVRLAPGVFVGSFAADLSELVHAASALRRHLTGRAWANEALETSGLEALLQVARRAPAGPWDFAVRRMPRRTELLPLTAGLAAALRAAERGGEPDWWAGGGPGYGPDDALRALELGLVKTA